MTTLHRREFLVRTGLGLGAAALAAARQTMAGPTPDPQLGDWASVRDQFELTRDEIHLACFFLASHPTPVRDAIERHRRGLDRNTIRYWLENRPQAEADVLTSASEYLGVSPTDIALTDSTTMGLGLLYGSLTLSDGQEILTTYHDHYSTEMSLRHRAKRTGTELRQVLLYRDGADASESEIVESIVRAMTPRTRVVAVTWVHSCTGVKLPLRAIADALTEVNAGRDEGDRALLCVDGVHGLGVDDVTMLDLGCDFFVAGTHKWLFGPRGTGLVWARPEAWPVANTIIPPFYWEAYRIWLRQAPPRELPPGPMMTPGGFHSFEHRWAVNEAFRFHQRIGKARVARRIHELNRQFKEGLAEMPHVKLHTPMSDELSAGIVTFEVDGMEPHVVVERLAERRIVSSTTPYSTTYARLAPSIINTPREIETTLAAVRGLG